MYYNIVNIIPMNTWATIVAATPSGIIGDSSGLLWNLPEDMRHFREMTTGHIVIMGRKTYESIGRHLPNRINIILSNCPTKFVSSDPSVIYTTLSELDHIVWTASQKARETASQKVSQKVFVIGGKEIYELLIDRVTEVYLTTVYWDHHKNPGLVSLSPEFMDKISKEFGRETIIQPRTASKRSGIEYAIVLLDKI